MKAGCWVEGETSTMYVRTVDIGEGGLRVTSKLPFANGREVRVTVNVAGRAQVVAQGVLAWSGRRGSAIQFVRVDSGRETLRQAV